jgi:hypothetical protein
VNAYDTVASWVDRIGWVGGANRARENDVRRVDLNGGPPPELELRLQAVTERLESIAADLEARLA